MSSHHHHGCRQADHGHDHSHQHEHQTDRPTGPDKKILVIRPGSGLAGDIMAAGLASLAEFTQADLDSLLKNLTLERLIGRVILEERQINQIGGAGLKVDLPEEHEHRHLKDIENFFERSAIDERAKALAIKTFKLLAEAEAAVHGRPIDQVHFHEVGALDSIMDIGLVSALLIKLNFDEIICGPLPVCDGIINCQHGLLLAPAPAVMCLLKGVPVTPLAAQGETVTPTAIAILKGAEATFGPWPRIVIENHTLAYGTRYFEGVPNGALFVSGHGHSIDHGRSRPNDRSF